MLHSSLRKIFIALLLAGQAIASTSFVDNVTFIGSQGPTNYYELAAADIGGPWTPSDLAQTEGWWDVSDEANRVIEDGTNVAALVDKSSNTNDMVKFSDATRPRLLTNQVNGLDTMLCFQQFSPTTRRFLRTTAGAYGSQNWGGVAVVNKPSVGGQLYQYLWADSSGVRFETRRAFAGNGPAVNDGTQQIVSSTVPSSGAAHILAYQIEDDGQIHLNGTPITSATWTANPDPLTGNWSLGANYTGANQSSMNANFGEFVLVRGTLADSDRELLEGYLAWKWGLEGSLPVTHPYKFAAPTK